MSELSVVIDFVKEQYPVLWAVLATLALGWKSLDDIAGGVKRLVDFAIGIDKERRRLVLQFRRRAKQCNCERRRKVVAVRKERRKKQNPEKPDNLQEPPSGA